jgi:prolyl-tRNA synthetase
MNHGDDNGLVLPPAIAPYQMVILELFGKKNDNVRKASIKISKELENDYRVFLDDSDKSMGFKSQE